LEIYYLKSKRELKMMDSRKFGCIYSHRKPIVFSRKILIIAYEKNSRPEKERRLAVRYKEK
jgi:hypothetical protein